MRVGFINSITGTVMAVEESRAAEYMAAGHRLAADTGTKAEPEGAEAGPEETKAEAEEAGAEPEEAKAEPKASRKKKKEG